MNEWETLNSLREWVGALLLSVSQMRPTEQIANDYTRGMATAYTAILRELDHRMGEANEASHE